MTKVKFFESFDTAKLENEINTWLSENTTNDLKVSMSTALRPDGIGFPGVVTTVMLTYTDY